MRKIRQPKKKKIWKQAPATAVFDRQKAMWIRFAACECQEMCIHSNPAGYANFQSIEGGLSGASSFCTEWICRMQ